MHLHKFTGLTTAYIGLIRCPLQAWNRASWLHPRPYRPHRLTLQGSGIMNAHVLSRARPVSFGVNQPQVVPDSSSLWEAFVGGPFQIEDVIVGFELMAAGTM